MNGKQNNMINANDYMDEIELRCLLEGFGFVCTSVGLHHREISLITPREYVQGVPCWGMNREENKLDSHVLVSVEDGQFVVYYFLDYDILFWPWDKLKGDIQAIELENMILDASKYENIFRRMREDRHETMRLMEQRKKRKERKD